MSASSSFDPVATPSRSAAGRASRRLALGRALFAVAIAGFGIEYLVSLFQPKGPWPGPPFFPAPGPLALLCGVVCFAMAAGLFSKYRFWAANICTLLLVFLIAVAYLPPLIDTPRNPGPWTSSAELAMMCASAVLVGSAAWPRALARILFSLPLVILGVQHFIYASFVATLVPAYIPFHLFWAYFVGVAFFAAAFSIATGIQDTLACTMLGVMLGAFVALLHIERVLRAPANGPEWTSLLVALMLSGGGFIASVEFGRVASVDSPRQPARAAETLPTFP